jgi:ketosteroid isomerase-like protein
MRAFNSGDAAKAAEVYDPDGYFMPNGHSPVKGRAGIEKYFRQDMADGVTSAQVFVGLCVRLNNFRSLPKK